MNENKDVALRLGRVLDAPERLVFHIHVPKTGGTSLNAILRDAFGAKNVLPIAEHNLSKIPEMPAERLTTLKAVFGPFQYGAHTAFDRPAEYLFLLRDPKRRLYSYYNFVRKRSQHPLHELVAELSFAQFLDLSRENRQVRNAIDNVQVKIVAGRRQAKYTDMTVTFLTACENAFAKNCHFGLLEEFPSYLSRLKAAGILQNAEPRHENVYNSSDNFEQAISSLTKDQALLLDRYTLWDQRFYDLCEQSLKDKSIPDWSSTVLAGEPPNPESQMVPVTAKDVRAAFLQVLGQPPGGEAVVQRYLGCTSVGDLIQQLAQSPEYVQKTERLMKQKRDFAVRDLETEALVFLHVPKCAGTSLHNTLVEWVGAEHTHPERRNHLYWCSAADLASKHLFSGHFDFYSTCLIPGRKRLITFLRDPVKRLISLYHFHRAHTWGHIEKWNLGVLKQAKSLSIDEYFADPVLSTQPGVNNSMVRYLSDVPQGSVSMAHPEQGGGNAATNLAAMAEQARTNLESFAFVGFVEDYDASIGKLAKMLGKQVPETVVKRQVLDVVMHQSPNLEPIERQEPSARTLQRLHEITEMDRELYDHARLLFG